MIDLRGPTAVALVLAAAVAPSVAGTQESSPPMVVRAFLVGVAEYPVLRARLVERGEGGRYETEVRLRGPGNDVHLVARTLVETLGARGEDLELCVSGGALEPTREAVLAGLDRLAERSGEDTLAVVYFAGHGTQLPDLDGDEDDGLDEVLLTADAVGGPGHGEGQEQGVVGLRDDELGAKVAAIRASGARVWLIVDACHSGSALRSTTVPGRRARQLDPALLGVAPPPRRARSSAGREQEELRRGLDRGVVAMSAVPPHQRALELPLGDEGQSHGLFTYHLVAQLLQRSRGETFGELHQRLRARLSAEGHAAHLPHVAGDLAAVIDTGRRAGPRSFAFAAADGLRLDAGRLHGVEVGDEYALYRPGRRGEAEAQVGTLRVERTSLAHSQVVAVSADAAPAVRLAPEDGPWPVQRTRSVLRPQRTRVAFEVLDPGEEARAASADQRRALLGPDADWIFDPTRHQQPPAGCHAERVPAQQADWIVRRLGGGDALLQLCDARSGQGLRVFTSDRLEEVLDQVHRCANLLRLATRGPHSTLPDGVRGHLETEQEAGWASVAGQRVQPGTRARLRLRNDTGVDWDLYAFLLTSDHRVARLFPLEGRSATVSKEEVEVVRGGLVFKDSSLGTEHVLVIALPSGSPSLRALGEQRAALEAVADGGLGGRIAALLRGGDRGAEAFDDEEAVGGISLIGYELAWGDLRGPPEDTPWVEGPGSIDRPPSGYPDGVPEPWIAGARLCWLDEGVGILFAQRGATRVLSVDLDGDGAVPETPQLAEAYRTGEGFDFELIVYDTPEGRGTILAGPRGGGRMDWLVLDHDDDPWGDACWVRDGSGAWVRQPFTHVPWFQAARLGAWRGTGVDRLAVLRRFFRR